MTAGRLAAGLAVLLAAVLLAPFVLVVARARGRRALDGDGPQARPPSPSTSSAARRWAPFAAFAALAITAMIARPGGFDEWAIYGFAAFGILALKGAASTTHTQPRFADETDEWVAISVRWSTVVAVVPAYNEDADTLIAAAESLFAQPNIVGAVFIDDASTDPETTDAIALIVDRWPGKAEAIYQPENRGKRWALHAGVALAVAEWCPEYIATVDSDTVLELGCVREALYVLHEDPDAAAVTGLVRARNWQANTLARLQDLRYSAAFLWERAAYSRVGAVLCVCGSFTLWRADLLGRLTTPLVEQRFLGNECTYGDDRHLTNLALAEGWRVRLAEHAVAGTLVPESWRHWLRQQTRWSRSFIRESLWAVRNLPPGWALTLTVVEFLTWIVFTAVLLTSLVISPLAVGTVAAIPWLVWVSVMAFARSVRYPGSRPEASRRARLYVTALAPVYGIVHLLIVLPLRLVALATMNETGWGTRKVVEVRS